MNTRKICLNNKIFKILIMKYTNKKNLIFIKIELEYLKINHFYKNLSRILEINLLIKIF